MVRPTGLTYVGACQKGAWHLELRLKNAGDDSRVRFPFRCRSWRHEGECREWCGRCDFVRVVEAMNSLNHWTSFVFTYPKREWPLVSQLFRFGYVSWSRMRKRFVKEWGPIKYIQSWEVHKSGYPHVNVVISNQ